LPESQPAELPPSKRTGKRKRLAVGLIILVLAVVLVAGFLYLTPKSPSITFEGIKLQVGPVNRHDTFKTSDSTYNTTSSSDDFLVVKARLLSAEIGSPASGNDIDRVNAWKREMGDIVDGWNVTVTDENGRVSEIAGYLSVTYPDISSQGEWIKPGEVTWLFAVAKTSQSFTLNLSGNQTIKLELS
jgi:hypothetical protein